MVKNARWALVISIKSSGVSLIKEVTSMASSVGAGNRVSDAWMDDMIGEIRSHSGVGMSFGGYKNVSSGGELGGPESYQVQSGDNLTAIAKRFNVSVNDLVNWNGIRDLNNIIKGQQLIVSDPEKATYNSSGNTTDNSTMNTTQELTGFLSLSADAIKELGGLDKARELLESGKFETVFNGQTRQWSVKFYGNKYVDAQFVNASKSAFVAKAARNSSCFKAIKNCGVGLNIAGLVFTGIDIGNNGFNPQNSADAIFGGYAFIPGYGWIISGVYFAIGSTMGWENAIRSYVETIRGFQESTGEKQLVPLMFKY